MEEVQQFGREARVVLLDIDGFKRVNETYGHPAGDATLKAVGNQLMEMLGPSDGAGRWGGEEFLFGSAGCEYGELQAIAGWCRKTIASSPIELEGETGKLTVSLGRSS